MKNADEWTVDGFGSEWSAYDQSALTRAEAERRFLEYFHIFPWDQIGADACGFDLGCGSGRWAQFVAPRVAKLYCIDASRDALDVARKNLADSHNVEFRSESVESLGIPDEGADFGYSLGVLHHVPDTKAALISCARKLKPGAPFLVYLYYRFDNRPIWYSWLWRLSDVFRRVISALPFWCRLAITKIVAALIYWPLARIALLFSKLGVNTSNWPLDYYKHNAFYTMQTDALDRFGTRLEKRFTKQEIVALLEDAGFVDPTFSSSPPYWCVVARKA